MNRINDPNLRRKTAFFGALSLAILGSFSTLSAAQPYPIKPIRLIVPFTPGGTTDILARGIGARLGEQFGQSVVIENIAGAGGSIGAERVAKSAPDGYTLLMGHIGTLAVNPALYPNLPYDPVRSFAPVAWVATVPNVLVVHPSAQVKSLKEWIAKSANSTMNYGSGGNGSAAHLAMEYLKLQTHASATHIPYKGTAPAVSDLLGGQIQAMFTGAPAVGAHVRAGKLIALAVSSATRLAALPEVPTVAESGFAGFEADQWYGVVAPVGTPLEIIAKLNAAINQSLGSAELKSKLTTEGALAAATTPQAFGAHIQNEIMRWRPVIAAGTISAN